MAALAAFATPLPADDVEDDTLWEAAKAGDVPTLRALLEQGAKPATLHPGKRHCIAIQEAACGGHLEAVKLLLAAAPDDAARAAMAEEALLAAVRAVDDAVLRYLLANKLGNPTHALPYCRDAGHSRLLLEAGADIHARHEYALRFAAFHGDAERVRFLLEHGADATAPTTFEPPDESGFIHAATESPLRYVICGHPNDNGRGYPAEEESARRVPVVKLLLEHGANPHDSAREPALCMLLDSESGNQANFVRKDRLAVARMLLEAGADVNAPDKDGTTPLHHAVTSPEALALLLEHGANPNAQDAEGRTPLHRVTEADITSVKLLCRHGADLHVRDNQGRTPLDFCRDGRVSSPELAALLKEMGEDTSWLNEPAPMDDAAEQDDDAPR